MQQDVFTTPAGDSFCLDDGGGFGSNNETEHEDEEEEYVDNGRDSATDSDVDSELNESDKDVIDGPSDSKPKPRLNGGIPSFGMLFHIFLF